ncbi:MAG: esterase/lipase family protein [Chloroflexota bacterium]
MGSTRQRRARWLVAAVFGIVALGGLPGAVSADAPDPVLLVHGWRGSPSTWSDMIARFAAQGRTAKAIALPGQDNIKNAAAIRDYITAQHWDRVDIVGQSMGGLSARYFIKTIGTTKVDTYVSLGTPQYGLYTACFLTQSAGGQMCPSSTFLRNLNAGDDTPTSVFWTTIYSRTDGVVPNSASRLDGGACYVFEDPGVGHNEMDNDETIFGHVLAAVDRTCVGTFKTT